jgi:hypothetical protein
MKLTQVMILILLNSFHAESAERRLELSRFSSTLFPRVVVYADEEPPAASAPSPDGASVMADISMIPQPSLTPAQKRLRQRSLSESTPVSPAVWRARSNTEEDSKGALPTGADIPPSPWLHYSAEKQRRCLQDVTTTLWDTIEANVGRGVISQATFSLKQEQGGLKCTLNGRHIQALPTTSISPVRTHFFNCLKIILAPCPYLITTIDLSGCNLTTIPHWVKELCTASAHIPALNVTTLNLSCNFGLAIDATRIPSCVKQLIVDHCGIVATDWCADLPAVTTLNLRGNHELNLTALPPQIEELDLTSCRIKLLPSLAGVVSLRSLNVSDNQGLMIPDGSLPTNLQTINVQGCRLSNLTALESVRTKLSRWFGDSLTEQRIRHCDPSPELKGSFIPPSENL